MRPSIERELSLLEKRLLTELRRELDARLLELVRHVDSELEAIQQRIDKVHEPALRLLTHRTRGGDPQ